MQLEVEELVGDLLARLAGEELLVLEDGRVDALEGEGAGHRVEVAEEPLPEAVLVGVEVARAAGRLKRLPALAHRELGTTTRGSRTSFC